MAIDRLVTDPAELHGAWEIRPLCSEGLGSFDDIFSLRDADDLVANRGLRLPDFRMLRDGVQLPFDDYTLVGGTGRNQFPGLLDSEAVRANLACGATLVLQGLRRYLPAVDDFCRRLGGELSHKMHANAYLTPPGSSGAGPHYDMHSVFIRQVSGVKQWRVQEPVEYWPRRRWSPDMPLGTPVVGEWTLREGDCLYLPRGFIHDGWTPQGDPSVHITFGTRDPVTWVNLLAGLVEEMDDELDLRATLPAGFSKDVSGVERMLRDSLQKVMGRLAETDVAAAARRIVDEHADKPRIDARGAIESFFSELSLNSRVACRRGVVQAWDFDDLHVGVRTSRQLVTLPRELEPALVKLLDGNPHRVSSLSELEPASALLLVTRLVREGLLVLVP